MPNKVIALANQKEKAETFERASRAAKASLQKKNISLEEDSLLNH